MMQSFSLFSCYVQIVSYLATRNIPQACCIKITYNASVLIRVVTTKTKEISMYNQIAKKYFSWSTKYSPGNKNSRVRETFNGIRISRMFGTNGKKKQDNIATQPSTENNIKQTLRLIACYHLIWRSV